MGNYGYSIPVMEINDDGVWVSNLPATTTTTTSTTTVVPTTTTSAVPATTTTAAPAVATTAAPATTTTTQVPLPDPEPEPEENISAPPPSVSGLPDGYDLFDAEWDGYPFEYTILLLEERYPPGTPDKFHFRLSVGVEFLRSGGMVRGLDNLWDSTS